MSFTAGAEGAEPLGRKLSTQRAQLRLPAGAELECREVPVGPEARTTAPVCLGGHVQAEGLVGRAKVPVGGAEFDRLAQVRGRAGSTGQGGVKTLRASWGRQSGAGSDWPQQRGGVGAGGGGGA